MGEAAGPESLGQQQAALPSVDGSLEGPGAVFAVDHEGEQVHCGAARERMAVPGGLPRALHALIEVDTPDQEVRHAGKQVVKSPVFPHMYRPSGQPGLLGQADVGQVLLVIVPGLDQRVLQQLGQRLAGSQVACGADWESSSAS